MLDEPDSIRSGRKGESRDAMAKDLDKELNSFEKLREQYGGGSARNRTYNEIAAEEDVEEELRFPDYGKF